MRPLVGCWAAVMAALWMGGLGAEARGEAKAARALPSPNEGSTLGVNLAAVVDYSPEMVFLDLFKQSRPWISQEKGKPWGQGPELDLTEEGWVKRFQPNQYASTVFCVAGGQKPGRYYCFYDGEGTFRLQGAARLINEFRGRLELEIADQEMVIFHIMSTNPENPVRNIRILRPEDARGAEIMPFASEFLDRYRPFKVVRFMDWMKTNDSKIRTWADRPKFRAATQTAKGVALEYMIMVSNELRADPWFCMPHLADDDYVRSFAVQVKAQLAPGLKIYVEHSNEVWNGIFGQAKYAAAKGQDLQLSSNRFQGQLFYHSKRSVEMFRIWSDVFGADRNRLVRVLPSQSANRWVSEQIMDYQNASKEADVLAIAPYFGNSLGDPKTADQVARMPLEDIFKECRRQIQDHDKLVKVQTQAASDRGLRLIAYEGGQHLVGYLGAENNQALTDLFHAANRDSRMADAYSEHLECWKRSGGQLYVLYSGMTKPGKWGSWGILESERQDPELVPKYRASLEFLRKNPQWWP